MNKKEFLNQLDKILSEQLSRQKVSEYITYYDHYITEKVQSGKRESEVIEELGGPRIIAKTILDNEKLSRKYSGDDTAFQRNPSDERESQRNQHSGTSGYEFHASYNGHEVNTTIAKIVVVLVAVAVIAVILGILMLLFRVLGWIVEILAPFILIGVIILFIKVFRKKL